MRKRMSRSYLKQIALRIERHRTRLFEDREFRIGADFRKESFGHPKFVELFSALNSADAWFAVRQCGPERDLDGFPIRGKRERHWTFARVHRAGCGGGEQVNVGCSRVVFLEKA